MSEQTLDRPVPPVASPAPRPWRAVLGAATMAVALGAGQPLGDAAAGALSLTGFPARLLPALMVTAIAVPLVAVLLRRDRMTAHQLGLTGVRASIAAMLLGITVTGGAAAVAFGLGTAAGWLTWSAFDPAAFAAFLVTNTVLAVLLEALPEELTFRGYAWRTLRNRFGGFLSALLTTGLFVLVLPMSIVVAVAVSMLLGRTPPPLGLAPAGEDPVAYFVLLVCFGFLLVAARTATAGASLFTCIAAHLTFLTVNRVVLFGEALSAGWHADLLTPDAVLLVPGYLLLAMVAFVLIGRATGPTA
ncbi:MAG TPA: CPBP family glutamic-type intramembrane protease, partial [Candidatus Limnocylindrales bacterium]